MDEFDSIQKIVDQLEMGNYQNEGGYLKNSIAFLVLKKWYQNENKNGKQNMAG